MLPGGAAPPGSGSAGDPPRESAAREGGRPEESSLRDCCCCWGADMDRSAFNCAFASIVGGERGRANKLEGDARQRKPKDETNKVTPACTQSARKQRQNLFVCTTLIPAPPPGRAIHSLPGAKKESMLTWIQSACVRSRSSGSSHPCCPLCLTQRSLDRAPQGAGAGAA